MVRRTGRSAVWKLVEVEEIGGKLATGRAFCLVCKQWIVGGANGSTSNYRTHLEKHTEEWKKALGESNEADKKDLGEAALKQWLRSAVPVTTAKKNEFQTAVLRMVVIDFQPLSVVSDAGFRGVIEAIDSRYVELLPSEKTLRKRIHEAGERMKSAIALNLRSVASFMAVAVDGWTSSAMDSYHAMHIHYIDEEWTLKSRTLGADWALRDSTADTLRRFVVEHMAKYGIEAKSVCAFVSDTASNIRAALEDDVRPSFPCLAHVLNLVVRDAFKAVAETKTLVDVVKSVVLFFKHSTKAYGELHQRQSELHMANVQLVNDNDTRWNSTLRMLRRFEEQRLPLLSWATSSNAAVASTIPQLRWTLMKGIVAVLESFQEATCTEEGDSYATISLVWPLILGILRELDVKSGSPSIPDASRGMGSGFGERSMSENGESAASEALSEEPIVLAAGESETHGYSLEDGDIVKDFALALKKSLQTRWDKAREVHGWKYVCATAIDPRWKTFRFRRETIRDVLLKAAKWCMKYSEQIRPETLHGGAHDSRNTADATAPPMKKRNTGPGLLERIRESEGMTTGDHTEKTETQKSAEVEVEVERYLDLELQPIDANPLLWWKGHAAFLPHLARLARLILCIPAESSAVERDFSAAGYFVSDRRSRLKPGMVCDLLLLHGNRDLLPNATDTSIPAQRPSEDAADSTPPISLDT
jgi:hypothetical protein